MPLETHCALQIDNIVDPGQLVSSLMKPAEQIRIHTDFSLPEL